MSSALFSSPNYLHYYFANFADEDRGLMDLANIKKNIIDSQLATFEKTSGDNISGEELSANIWNQIDSLIGKTGDKITKLFYAGTENLAVTESAVNGESGYTEGEEGQVTAAFSRLENVCSKLSAFGTGVENILQEANSIFSNKNFCKALRNSILMDLDKGRVGSTTEIYQDYLNEILKKNGKFLTAGYVNNTYVSQSVKKIYALAQVLKKAPKSGLVGLNTGDSFINLLVSKNTGWIKDLIISVEDLAVNTALVDAELKFNKLLIENFNVSTGGKMQINQDSKIAEDIATYGLQLTPQNRTFPHVSLSFNNNNITANYDFDVENSNREKLNESYIKIKTQDSMNISTALGLSGLMGNQNFIDELVQTAAGWYSSKSNAIHYVPPSNWTTGQINDRWKSMMGIIGAEMALYSLSEYNKSSDGEVFLVWNKKVISIQTLLSRMAQELKNSDDGQSEYSSITVPGRTSFEQENEFNMYTKSTATNALLRSAIAKAQVRDHLFLTKVKVSLNFGI